MSEWYYKVTVDPTDLTPLVDCIEFFEKEYQAARKEVAIKGRLEQDAARMPGIVEYRYSQLQELEALVVWADLEVKKVRTAAFKKFLESYARTLTSRDAQMYAEAEPSVLQALEIHNQICLMRNKFVSIMKGLTSKEFQISNITKLRVAGLDDAYLDY
jgi:hypothetical protein